MREQRRLAAIAAADVVGYSRLMGRDESGTVARVRRARTERLEPILARRGGRVVKLTGDGALIEFASAVEALAATIEFQQAMTEDEAGRSEGDRLVFRIGLHLGDVIVDKEDLYGDGVNVASRLETQASPGGILVSGDVHNATAGRLAATFEDLGPLTLKNIERAVQAYSVHWRTVDWPVATSAGPIQPAASAAPPSSTPLQLPDKPSIAVLPFQNMSGDPQQEYFVDGLVEDITTALSRFKSVFVIARNSSFTYKGKAVEIRQVGRELGVRYALEGSVRKAASRVRITGQLIECETGAHIWADRYDGDLSEVFELQDKVTMDVVCAITPKLEQAEIARASRKPTENLGAYDCYLRGMSAYYSSYRLREARQYCHRAMELDPGFAIAHAMAAYCDAMLIGGGSTFDADAVAATARLVKRAVELDWDDASVLVKAAWAQAHVVRDLDIATGYAERALLLNPNLALSWAINGWLSVWLGQPEIGLAHFERAMRLSPLEPDIRIGVFGVAHASFMAERYEEAWSRAQTGVKVWQTPPAYRIAAASAALAGHSEEAARYMRLLLTIDPTRRLSNFVDVLGPYRRPEDIERYKHGMRLAGLPE